MPRTFVYVDGFNLYYRALKDSPYKWLDLKALVTQLIKSSNKVVAIKYYTARVAGSRDPGSPRRQQAYINAISTLPEVQIFYGRFLAKDITRPLVNPIPGVSRYVKVHSMEEKGSDVNLASHLIHDGWAGRYDVAVVVSNDSDLEEPIRIVTQELKKPVGVLCPHDGGLVKQLADVCTFRRAIRSTHLARAQFPNPVAGATPIHKPTEWK